MKTEHELKRMIEYPKEGILSKDINKGKTDVTLFCMSKGTKISDHTSTRDAIVYVMEGEGIFRLKEKDIKMNEGKLIIMKPGEVHSLSAKKDTSFVLILS